MIFLDRKIFLSSIFKDVNENDSILLNVPFYHCFGCVIGSLAMMTRGARMVIPAPTFDALKGLRASAAEKTNIWYGTPTMFVDFLGTDNF